MAALLQVSADLLLALHCFEVVVQGGSRTLRVLGLPLLTAFSGLVQSEVPTQN